MSQFDNVHHEAYGPKKDTESEKAALVQKLETPKDGYPDTGNGYYAKMLPFADWYKFNCCQRIQMNYLEHLPSVLTFISVSALLYPKETAYLTIAYIIGRQAYAFGYYRGHQNRIVGALVLDLAILAFFVYSMIVCHTYYNKLGWTNKRKLMESVEL
mmetsp:Transcript_15115/g.10594  ORF Transcript_15115/g.10594 Transcript_15115/m.10594 type:complete len:157 (+) Transcript_15115:207-677(+)